MSGRGRIIEAIEYGCTKFLSTLLSVLCRKNTKAERRKNGRKEWGVVV